MKCNLCKGTSFNFLYKTKDRMYGFKDTFYLYECVNCRLLFLNPQPSQKKLIKFYPSKKYYAYNMKKKKGVLGKIREYLIEHYYSPNVVSKFISFFIKKVPAIPEKRSKGKILDLGCGTGETLVLLQKLGWSVYGMDMDKKALEIARKKGIKNLKFGTYRDLKKYPNNYFDSIRLFHVIEHLDDPSQAIKLINKKLKKGGELLVGTPNADSILTKLFKKNWYNLDSPRHLYLFSPITLSMLIKSGGLNVKSVEFSSVGGLPGSLQYLIEDKFSKKIDLVHKSYIIILFYPIEWLLDKFKKGDVVSIRAIK